MTGHARAAVWPLRRLQTSPDSSGAIVHNAKAQSTRFVWFLGQADTVIGYAQDDSRSRSDQTNHNFPSLSMLVGIDHGFTRDQIEMRCNSIILDIKRFSDFQPAGCLPNFAVNQISQRV